MTKVATILSVYKKDLPSYFTLAVDSILSQQGVEVKLYIGVDGPIGEELTLAISEYKDRQNIQICWFPENRGLAAVLNDLLTLCFEDGYDFIARMDADDIARPYRFFLQTQYLQTHLDIDVVGGAINQIDEDGKNKGVINTYPSTHKECYEYFSKRDPLAHPAVLFRKSFFQKAGRYRPEYRKNQDTMLWYDGLRNGCKMANLPEVLIDFRINEDFYKHRRNGYKFAYALYKDRKKINQDLKYGIKAHIYAFLLFIFRISPVWIKKIVYKKK